ncbi:MAG: PKD domain-containing protein [Massilia sp.]
MTTAIAAAVAAVSLVQIPTASAQSARAADSAAAPVRYRVINLAPGQLAQQPAVNANGQAIVSVSDGDQYRAWFFDGARTQPLGRADWPLMYATGLNDRGEVTGSGGASFDSQHAFHWSAAAGLQDIGGAAPSSHATAVNRDGVIAGDTASPLEPVHGVRWTAAGGLEQLGSLNNFTTVPVAIGDDGLITGFSDTASNDTHAFAWTRANGIRDMGTLGGAASYPVAAGASGQVAGYSQLSGADGHWRAFYWTAAGGMRNLGALNGTDSFALAMNRLGQVAGVINLDNGYQRGFSWTAAGGMVDIGTLGGPGARPLAVNGKGVLGGWSWNARQASRAFLWSAGASMIDLDTRLVNAPAGLHLQSAAAVSDNGVIVAESNVGLVLLRPVGQAAHPAPVVGPIDTAAIIKPGSAAAVKLAFNDSDAGDTHRIDWQWGDQTMETGQVHEANGSGSANAVHVYRAAGTYTITARVSDTAGNSTTVKRDVVVADPARGTTAATGQVLSPQGAVRAEPSQSGAARFTFVAPSAGGSAGAQAVAGAPAGLRFSTGKTSFASSSVVRGAPAAPDQQRFSGAGELNGKGGYQYSLTIAAAAAPAAPASAGGDGASQGTGQFALRIWHKDPSSQSDIVDYDNSAGKLGTGTRLSEGAVVLAR